MATAPYSLAAVKCSLNHADSQRRRGVESPRTQVATDPGNDTEAASVAAASALAASFGCLPACMPQLMMTSINQFRMRCMPRLPEIAAVGQSSKHLAQILQAKRKNAKWRKSKQQIIYIRRYLKSCRADILKAVGSMKK